MTRKVRTAIDPVTLGVAPAQPELTNIVARPTHAEADRSAGMGAAGLAQGLAAFSPSLMGLLESRKKERIARETVLAQQDALQDGNTNYGDAIHAISPDAAPWVRSAYMQTTGAVAGADYNNRLLAKAEAEFDMENPDPAYAEQFAREFYNEQTAGLDDTDYLETFMPQAMKANAAFLASNRARLERELVARKHDAVRKLVSAQHDNGEFNAQSLEDLKGAARGMRLSPQEAEAIAFEMSAVRAVEDKNPHLLLAFTARTADNQSSFSERFPAEYQRAWNAGIASLKQKAEDVAEVVKMRAKDDINQRLDGAKSGLEEIDIPKLYADVERYVIEGALTGDAGASYVEQGRAANRTYMENLGRAEAMLQGTWQRRSGDSAKDRDTAARLAAKRAAAPILADATLSDEQKADLISRRIVEMGLKNRVMNPDHVGALRQGMAAMPEDGSMPPDFMTGAMIGFAYWKEDPLLVRQELGDDFAPFYDKFYTLLQQDPQNPEAAYRGARQAIIGERKAGRAGPPTGVSSEQFNKIRKNAHKQLTDSTAFYQRWLGREGKPSFEQDVYAQTELGLIARDMLERNPSMSHEDVAEQAYKKFASTHKVVNGQWLNTSALGFDLDEDKTQVLEEALGAFLPILRLREGMLDDEMYGSAKIYLHPEPARITASGPEYRVYVGDRATAQLINIDAFMRQYQSQGTMGDPDEANTLVNQIKDLGAYPGDAEIEAMGEKLALYEQAGLVAGGQFKDLKSKLEAIRDRHEGEKLAVQAATTEAAQVSDPLIKSLRVPVEAESLVHLQAPLAGDPRGREVARRFATRVQDSANSKDYRDALGASLAVQAAGYGETVYKNGGRTMIGAGYDLGQKDSVIVKDLVRAGIATGPDRSSALDVDTGGFTPDRVDKKKVAEGMLRALRDGRMKLTEDDVRRLAAVQIARVAEDIDPLPAAIKGVLATSGHTVPAKDRAAAAWRVGSQHTRAALAVLYIHSKDWDATQAALEAGNWQAVRDGLRLDNPDAAMTAIRLLAQDPVKFRGLVTNQ